jgi:protein TonB
VLILSLHTLVIYGLASGMARKVLEAVPDRVQVSFMTKPAPRYQPPPRPDIKVEELHVRISPTGPIPDIEPDLVTVAGFDVQPPQVASSSSSGTTVVNRIMGGPGQGFPNTADYYPDASRRLGEKGSAMVHVCVDGAGRLTADPTIAQSSGSARLDVGAVRLAKAGSGHYRPTTEDGSPVSGCYAFRVRFMLRD